MTCREVYNKYLESQHWADLRDQAFNRANRRCEACAGRAAHGHHLIYRNPLTECTADDIMALCEKCHGIWHDWLKQMGWKPGEKFCRGFTRGAILVLKNPIKVEQPKPKPIYAPVKTTTPVIRQGQKAPKLSKKQRRRLRQQQADELAAKWKAKPIPTPAIPVPKADKRAVKVARMDERNKALKYDGVEAAINSMCRLDFRNYIYATFAGNPDWNSILSYAFAAYDRRRPEELAKVREANRQRAKERAERKAEEVLVVDPTNCPF